MFILRSAVVAAAVATFANAAPSAFRHVVHEKREVESKDWVKGARIESDAIIPMRIGLTQTNLDKGYDYLMEVSHPESPKYGKYWSPEDVHDMFAPPEAHVEAVKNWIISFGIHSSRVVHSDNKGWIAFDATVEEAERLLLAEFYEHEHKHSSKVRVGTDKYHVPEHLQPHIDYITPGIKLTPVVKRRISVERRSSWSKKQPDRLVADDSSYVALHKNYNASVPASLAGCSFNMTPTCYRALYDIPFGKKATKGNSLGLYEQGDYFSKSDIDLFFATWEPYVPQGTYPVPALIDGANYSVPADSPDNGGEADVDIEIATSLIYPQTVTLYQVDDYIYAAEELATTNIFNTFLDALDGSYCNYTAYGETGDDPSIDAVYPDPQAGGYNGTRQCGVYKPTNVISASYGQAEADLPVNYTKRQCNEFMKLGLQGHSILIATGDYGVASFPDDGTANGCLGPEQTIFNPQYPNGCPYVTAVGGTMLYHGQTVNEPESVMNVDLGGTATNFSSAGGFSNYFPQPQYQKSAVEKYFHRANLTYPYYSEFEVNVSTTTGLYNRIGRGYPDVSANGAYFPIFLDGVQYHEFGTSLAAPLFASVLTLLNEERFAIGKGPIGFVNAVLYANPWVLNDITNGTNLGCGSEGFPATTGWDAATGLGTPNYPKMKSLFLSLP
ncbi:hypothetical protein BP6252_12109 [Coleophoma cylindrospora]|uniref:Peptidase S53 domain-containing protein n=1 Tax=Coleophoma cylindrospora TaxID=1849047 RepID=A0A3D8QFU5_9HELO|nr:hypothetical protein BP6252_12109 [Coleophoma cylindrospora]